MMENFGASANPITLSALTTMVGNAVRTQPHLQSVWVVAELMDVRQSGGHFYMELIEKDGRGATVAKIRANMWAGVAIRLRSKFYQTTGRDISTGIKVMLNGSVTHHNLYGLSFNIQDIDPSYTLGDLERLRREILATLQREGILEANRSLPFPEAPQKIAVISAAGAAGYGDFTDQLASTPEGLVFYPLLFPAVMQGERTADSVIAALDTIEMSLDFWDAVVIIRGGGSTSDLNGFDNLELARRVATFPIPIIVGIGHERDRTVLDDIACIRCKTPTAVAAFLIDTLRNTLDHAQELARQAATYTSERLEGDKRQLETFLSLLPTLTSRIVTAATLRLQKAGAGLPSAVNQQTSTRLSRLASLSSALELSTKGMLSNASRKLEETAQTLITSADTPLQLQRTRLEHLNEVIQILSPQNTLKRGYSVTRLNGRAVTSPSEIPPGSTLETTLLGGTITSKT